jgi:secreted trypsin-like serine protease
MSLPFLLVLSLPGVIGGTVTNEYPDCVAVGWVLPKTERFELVSSGTLVTPRLVLTMGYVSTFLADKKHPIAVYLGADIGKPGHVFRVQRVINDPEADPGNHERSLSLLVLDQDVPANIAQPRPIAPAAVIDAAHILRVIGFGVNESFGAVASGLKRRADIPIVVSDCGKAPEAQGRYGCRSGEIVAISPGGQDTASGDSGGPACIEDGGQWFLAAITDRAVANATRPSGDGGVYIRLDKYQEWIRQTARDVSPKLTPAAAAPASSPVISRSPNLTGIPGKFAKSAKSILQSPSYRNHLKQFAQARIAQGRVVGGVPTSQFPDCVAVGDATGRFFATGTLVAPRVVVTAGHAFVQGIGKIMIGDDFLHPEAAVATINVTKVVLHPKFIVNSDPDLPHFLNDLTVLILERDVKPEEARPRAFAPEATIRAAPEGLVVGFGSTGNFTIAGAGSGPKRSVEIPLASCGCDNTTDGVADLVAFGCASGQELVAADPLRRKDTCEGDSGGPLYVKQDGKWFLAGATSRGTKSNEFDVDKDTGLPLRCGIGGIYVRLDKYKDWIHQVAVDNGLQGP